MNKNKVIRSIDKAIKEVKNIAKDLNKYNWRDRGRAYKNIKFHMDIVIKFVGLLKTEIYRYPNEDSEEVLSLLENIKLRTESAYRLLYKYRRKEDYGDENLHMIEELEERVLQLRDDVIEAVIPVYS